MVVRTNMVKMEELLCVCVCVCVCVCFDGSCLLFVPIEGIQLTNEISVGHICHLSISNVWLRCVCICVCVHMCVYMCE